MLLLVKLNKRKDEPGVQNETKEQILRKWVSFSSQTPKVTTVAQ